jgi:hypothetical protein
MPAPLNSTELIADEAIRCWPDVRAKNVFGHHGYVRGGKMFAFIAESGLAHRATSIEVAEALYEAGTAEPFVYHGSMEMRGWPVMPITGDGRLAAALSAARNAYENLG